MTKKPRENRVPIMMSDEEVRAIDDWRFRNRIATRSDAIRKLAQGALSADRYASDIAALHLSIGTASVEAKNKIRDYISAHPDPDNLSQDDVLIMSSFTFDAFHSIDRESYIMAELFFSYVREVNSIYGSDTFEDGFAAYREARLEADKKLASWRDKHDALEIIERLTSDEALERLK